MKCSICGKEISGINKIVAIHGTIDNPLCSDCASSKTHIKKSDEEKRNLKQVAFDKFHEKMNDELLEIWDKKNRNENSDIEFEVIGEILKSRRVSINIPDKTINNVTNENYEQTKGGFWSFDKMVSGSLIKVLYVLGAIGITLFSIIMLNNGSQVKYGGSTIILLALVYLVIGNLLWRIVCEGIIIIFKIFEKLNQIEKKLDGNENIKS